MLHPRSNQWLDQLAESDFVQLHPHLRLVSLPVGERLRGAGDPIKKLHFPITALIALSRELREGVGVDTALIGAEGVVGLRGLIDDASLHSVHVATSGLAYAIDMADFLPVWQGSVSLQRMCLRAGTRILDMVSTELTCSRFHDVEARLAKWILLRHDHRGNDLIETTHQTIADSLGVRREAVTNGLRKLGGVQGGRGSLEVFDRRPLEAACCECYFTLRMREGSQMPLPFQTASALSSSAGGPKLSAP